MDQLMSDLLGSRSCRIKGFLGGVFGQMRKKDGFGRYLVQLISVNTLYHH